MGGCTSLHRAFRCQAQSPICQWPVEESKCSLSEAMRSVFQAEDGIRDADVTGVQTCALPIWTLEPYEEHVLRLVDGELSVADICRESEIGDKETMKVLYALVSTSLARVKGKKVRALDRKSVV